MKNNTIEERFTTEEESTETSIAKPNDETG